MPEQTTEIRDHRRYGGQIRNFTDLKGNNYPESFWMKGLVCDPFEKVLEIRNYGFESAAIFDAGGKPFAQEDTGVPNEVFRGTAFDRIVNANVQLVVGIIMGMKNIQSLIKNYPSADGTEMISFFDEAEDVPFPE